MFERNIDSYSLLEQKILSKSNVLIVGVGAGGCLVSEILVRTGINVTLVDGDKFEESNLNRQIGSNSESLGKYKAEYWATCLSNISNKNYSPKVDFLNVYAPNQPNGKKHEELVFNAVSDTTDGRTNKKIVQTMTKELGIPYITGGIGNRDCWTGYLVHTDIYKILSTGYSPFAEPSTCFIQAGMQARMIIDVLLKRIELKEDKIIFLKC